MPQTETGQLSHPGEAHEGRYFRARGHEYGSSGAYRKAGSRMCLVILGMSAVPSLKFRSCRAISSALSIHFEPSGSFLLTRSLTVSFAATRAAKSASFSASEG